MYRVSKKALKEQAELLGAERISRNNIYDYENERGKICKREGLVYWGVSYSANSYKNIARLDVLKKDGKVVKFVYYAE